MTTPSTAPAPSRRLEHISARDAAKKYATIAPGLSVDELATAFRHGARRAELQPDATAGDLQLWAEAYDHAAPPPIRRRLSDAYLTGAGWRRRHADAATPEREPTPSRAIHPAVVKRAVEQYADSEDSPYFVGAAFKVGVGLWVAGAEHEALRDAAHDYAANRYSTGPGYSDLRKAVLDGFMWARDRAAGHAGRWVLEPEINVGPGRLVFRRTDGPAGPYEFAILFRDTFWSQR